jgi:hypothetical protein
MGRAWMNVLFGLLVVTHVRAPVYRTLVRTPRQDSIHSAHAIGAAYLVPRCHRSLELAPGKPGPPHGRRPTCFTIGFCMLVMFGVLSARWFGRPASTGEGYLLPAKA